MAFLGKLQVKLDEKGRLFLPAKARAPLAEGAYLTGGQDHCLYLFGQDQFDQFCDDIREQTLEDMTPTDFDRVLFFTLTNPKLDKQGRLTIPQDLRKFAGLDREALVIGMPGRLELWDLENWQNYSSTFFELFASAKSRRG
ncbi:MAG: cell division/cell wall cluster transcriptional repressor MraZ [Micrococcales bacterium]|nr:cell division/cell wall cluster transcriptional repressor MraZ [Micrococcales bacterium]